MLETRHSDGGVEVLVCRGRLDAAVSERLRSEVFALIESGRTRLLFDLAALELIDSSGLSLFLAVLRTLRERGGGLALFNLPQHVRKVLEVTRLDKALPLYGSESEARAALGL